MHRICRQNRPYPALNLWNVYEGIIIFLFQSDGQPVKISKNIAMHYKRIFSIPDYSLSFKITSVSHPWAYFATCFQSHTSVCSFQQVTKSTPRMRPLRPRNFKGSDLNHAPSKSFYRRIIARNLMPKKNPYISRNSILEFMCMLPAADVKRPADSASLFHSTISAVVVPQ